MIDARDILNEESEKILLEEVRANNSTPDFCRRCNYLTAITEDGHFFIPPRHAGDKTKHGKINVIAHCKKLDDDCYDMIMECPLWIEAVKKMKLDEAEMRQGDEHYIMYTDDCQFCVCLDYENTGSEMVLSCDVHNCKYYFKHE